MNDMRAVIIPKSDQINADNLIGGPMTITVTEVIIRPGTEQPVSIHFNGDDDKPYKPCKSMAKVMVHCWGADAAQYIGRSMTLYRDGKVLWGGMAVGGIRISHLSHISESQTMALTETKGKKKPFTVKPLVVAAEAPVALLTDAKEKAAEGLAAYQIFWKVLTKPQQAALVPHHEGLKAAAIAADEARARAADADAGEAPTDDDTFPGDRP